MFLDASSIAAQGNQAYDLSKFVNPAHPLPAGATSRSSVPRRAPTCSALKVFSQNNVTTTSDFMQAINYAVATASRSSTSRSAPTTSRTLAADVIRQADDAAVAAGVTVVAIDRRRRHHQHDRLAGDRPERDQRRRVRPRSAPTLRTPTAASTCPASNGQLRQQQHLQSSPPAASPQTAAPSTWWRRATSNWALCDANIAMYTDCTNENGAGSPIQFTGGTSESVAADRGRRCRRHPGLRRAHGGTDPTPALVKQILTSTATDIYAPATQQGAGLLNVAAAVGTGPLDRQLHGRWRRCSSARARST